MATMDPIGVFDTTGSPTAVVPVPDADDEGTAHGIESRGIVMRSLSDALAVIAGMPPSALDASRVALAGLHDWEDDA